MANYTLKTGQINFLDNDNRGAYACVVIKDGEFFNLTDELRQILIDKLSTPVRAGSLTEVSNGHEGKAVTTPDLEDMF